jgi:hypothetical protein
MAKRCVWAWALFALVVVLILFRKPSFANVRAAPPGMPQTYFINPSESCAEGYNQPDKRSLKCQKK